MFPEEEIEEGEIPKIRSTKSKFFSNFTANGDFVIQFRDSIKTEEGKACGNFVKQPRAMKTFT